MRRGLGDNGPQEFRGVRDKAGVLDTLVVMVGIEIDARSLVSSKEDRTCKGTTAVSQTSEERQGKGCDPSWGPCFIENRIDFDAGGCADSKTSDSV